ncbi:MAG: polyisoprenoid-binding protein [Bdellovibrionales bacterium]|nr:polyisoprenoid-binding protein [Bdellovibrionales bacterium]
MKRLLLAATLLLSGAAYAQNTPWVIDSAHASVVFKVSHMGFSNIYGMFSGIEGTIVWDEKKPEATSFELKIPTASVNTGVAKRDDHLRNTDFFNAKQFPHILVKSKSVKKNGANLDVVADVTMLGVTKPVNFTFHVMKTGKDFAPGSNKMRTGGEATFKIKRSDFGMKYMVTKPGEPGDELEVIVNLEALK